MYLLVMIHEMESIKTDLTNRPWIKVVIYKIIIAHENWTMLASSIDTTPKRYTFIIILFVYCSYNNSKNTQKEAKQFSRETEKQLLSGTHFL